MTILAIHGGAGGDGEWRGLTSLDPERIRCMQNVLQSIGEALQSGSIHALEAVTQAVELMENEPLFNAGTGSVLDEDGSVTICLLYTSPSPRDATLSRMPSSA